MRYFPTYYRAVIQIHPNIRTRAAPPCNLNSCNIASGGQLERIASYGALNIIPEQAGDVTNRTRRSSRIRRPVNASRDFHCLEVSAQPFECSHSSLDVAEPLQYRNQLFRISAVSGEFDEIGQVPSPSSKGQH